MMRILMVGPDPLNKGGIATLERNILESAHDNSYQYTMHVARPEGSFLLKFLLVPLYTLYFMLRTLTGKYKVVHIHISENWGFYRYVPFILYASLLGMKIVIHPNACEFDSFYARQSERLKALIRYCLNKADYIFTVSTEWADVFKSISTTKVAVIFNFVDVPPANSYKPDSTTLTASGQLGKRKGYYDLVKAVPDVIAHNENLAFKFCGNGEVKEIQLELDKLNMSRHVQLTGWLDNKDVKEILKDTMLFVLPTYNEGMPLAILEAMSYGIPVVSTYAGGIPSLVENGVNGILVDAGNIEELKKAIIKLVDDRELRIEMSKRNYAKILKDFGAESNMLKIYRIYDEITK
jgi:glycosyltransferase involved in cell wall biosynthesis